MSNLADKAIDIKGKKYVLVSDRILWFNQNCPKGAIHTTLISQPDAERVVIKAKVYPDADNQKRCFTGYSQALWGDGFINKTSAIENAETSAVGRALALMGIGVIDSIASVDEIEKAEIQSKMQTSPQATKEIGEMLEIKGITDPQDKQTVVKAIAGKEALNTSGIARLKKEITNAESDTLKQIVIDNER